MHTSNDISKLYSTDLESGILIDLLMSNEEPEKLEICSEIEPEDFYKPINQLLFSNIKKQVNKTNGKIDTEYLITSVEEKNEYEDVRGYISKLLGGTYGVVSSNIKMAVNKLRDLSVRRQLLSAVHKANQAVFDFSDGIDTIINKVQSEILEVKTFSDDEAVKASDVADAEIDKISDVIAARKSGTYQERLLYSGINGYDKLVGGFLPGTVNYIAARPGSGKTSFAIQLSLNFSMLEIPCCFFSLEMTKTRLIHKIMANLSRFDSKKFKGYDFEESELEGLMNANAKLFKRNVMLDDNPRLTPEILKAKTNYYKKKYGCKIFFIDYIQNMDTEKHIANTVDRISLFSRQVQAIAKETDTVFFPLAQCNREVEKRSYENGGKKPIMSDLKGSAQLEQDADSICFIYRDCLYNPQSNINRAELILGKNRDGEQGLIELTFHPEYSAFFNKSYLD